MLKRHSLFEVIETGDAIEPRTLVAWRVEQLQQSMYEPAEPAARCQGETPTTWRVLVPLAAGGSTWWKVLLTQRLRRLVRWRAPAVGDRATP